MSVRDNNNTERLEANVEIAKELEQAPVIEEEPLAGTEVADPEVIAAPPAPVELVYEYQITDDHGRPIGGKQVFKGKSEREITEKIARAHQESMKLNRDLKRKNRLGIVDTEDIPQNVRKMSDDEEAFANLTVEQRLAKLEEENLALRARAEAELFRQSTPSYYPCPENFETIANWMVKNDLSPIHENFEYAFKKLSEAGLLLTAPIVREEPTPVVEPVKSAPTVEIPANTQPEVVQESRITNTEQSQQTRVARPASGLNKSVISSNDAPIVSTEKAIDQITYTVPAIIERDSRSGATVTKRESVTYKGWEALDRMPAEEYKRRLKDPNFRKIVDTAPAEASA